MKASHTCEYRIRVYSKSIAPTKILYSTIILLLAAYKALHHVVEIESGKTSVEEPQRVRAAGGEAVRVPAAGNRAVGGRSRTYRHGWCKHCAQQLRERLQTAQQAMWLS